MKTVISSSPLPTVSVKDTDKSKYYLMVQIISEIRHDRYILVLEKGGYIFRDIKRASIGASGFSPSVPDAIQRVMSLGNVYEFDTFFELAQYLTKSQKEAK